MSTILEALRKSEEERKVTKVPTLADMPAPHEPQRWPNYLLFAIFALLLVLIGLAAKLVLFPSDKPGILGGLTTPKSISTPADESSGVADGSLEADGSSTANGSSVAADGSSVANGSAVEGQNEAVSLESKDAIEVNVVSYSDQPEKRFVMVGGKLFRENEFVRAGLKVEEIRQNEVVFNFRGEQIIRRP